MKQSSRVMSVTIKNNTVQRTNLLIFVIEAHLNFNPIGRINVGNVRETLDFFKFILQYSTLRL